MAAKGPTKHASSRKKVRLASPSASARVRRTPDEIRRHRGPTGCDDLWEDFVSGLEDEISDLDNLPDDVRKSPFYSLPNVVKRAAYNFMIFARKKIIMHQLQVTIDRIRIAKAGSNVVLRTLRKNIKTDPYYWVLMGLHLDCPVANIRKADVTRFSQHLKYARRHKVPPEYLIGFLLQSGSLTDIYRRVQNPDYREPWYVTKNNPRSVSSAGAAAA